MHEALRPWSGAWGFDAAAHLWRRAAFCAPPRVIDATARKTPAEAVDAMVDGPERDAATDGLESIYQSVLGADSPGAARAWLLTRMVRCGHQLREKLALFLHGHFATSIRKVERADWMLRQYRLFLDHGLEPFGDLLLRVTRDPAMIRWLDNETNRKGHPNENYARELFELFTLGDGNYSEKDIQEAARAFTGWHVLNHRYHFSKVLHDHGEKTVLGQTGRFGGEEICRIALEQDACGRFLARKLLRFFVTPEPAADVVKALGAEMKRSGYDTKATLKLLFRSRYFFADQNRRSLVKSPIEYVVGAARTLGAKLDAEDAAPLLRAMGQDLLAPPNVKGWPGQRAWINTTTWLVRVNAARRLAGEVAGRLNERDLERFSRAFCGRPLPEAEKKTLRSGAGKRDLAHALLSLPEAHLA